MANTYTKLYIQIVFAVKGRASLIREEFRDELQKYMTGIIQNKKQKLYAIYCMPDHVHIFVSMGPELAISDLVRDVKANATSFINDKRWIEGHFEWQRGFGAFSYSESQVQAVVNYVLNQRKSSMKQERWGEEAAESNLQLKLETKFTPDASYAAALIRNANTMEYPLPPFPEDPVMKGSYSFVSYSDSTQKTATVKALYVYLNDGTNRFKSTEMDYLNGTKNKIVYYYSPLGLLDSMKSFTNGKPDYTLKYKYLHDRYISYTNNNDNSRREFIFNTLKQVATIKDFDSDNTISMYRSFKFDDRGRILTESRYKDYYTLEGKMEYTYNDSHSKVLATLKTYDNDKLTYELSRQKQGNHFVQKNKSIYGYESSSIDSYSKDGVGLSKNYTNGKMSGYFVTQKIAD